MNDFNKLLDDLKLISEIPRLYLANYFEDFKNKIDLIAAHRCLNETDKEIRKALNDNWSELIKKIELFEDECVRRVSKFKSSIDLIDQIEKNISNSIEIEELIRDKIKSFEGELFLNRTILFLEKHKSRIPELFSKMDSNVTFGKLIIIKNKYYNLLDLNFVYQR